MKKIFTLLFSVGCLLGNAQNPFQPNSVVVFRAGDGSAPLRSVATKIFLDEYSPTGTLIQSVPLPTTPSGANFSITCSGTATSEGLITRSADSRYILVGGYNTDTGYTSVSGSSTSLVERVIARVDAQAGINVTTKLGSKAFSGNNIRSVTSVDGTSFWACGAGSGVRYCMLGDTSTTQVTASKGTTNFRNIDIYGGQLLVTSSSSVTNTLGDTIRFGAVGIGLPVDTGNIVRKMPGIPTATSMYQFFLADLNSTIPGPDVLYIANDDSTQGLQKYSLVGTTWVLNGSVLPTSTNRVRGLAGSVTAGVVTLYITSSSSKLYSLVDNTGYNLPMTSTFTELASAGTNMAFRGVALAPQSTVAPLKLISFKAVLATEGVNLNWTSTNEVNVRDFAVERSKDGINYSSIGSITGRNRSEATYAFLDKAPVEGMNYYRLKMNDNNGSFKYSNVSTVLNKRVVKVEVYPNPAANNITISHSKALNGSNISITTAGGQLVKTINVEFGSLQTMISVENLQRGHYLVVFNNNGEKAVTKFMKQ